MNGESHLSGSTTLTDCLRRYSLSSLVPVRVVSDPVRKRFKGGNPMPLMQQRRPDAFTDSPNSAYVGDNIQEVGTFPPLM